MSIIYILNRNPLPWGSMKYLCEKIPKHVSSKVRINRDLYTQDRYDMSNDFSSNPYLILPKSADKD